MDNIEDRIEGNNDIEPTTNIIAQINNINSPYITVDLLASKRHFCIAHLNVRSLDKNGPSLNNLLDEVNQNIDILTLSEIWGNYNDFKHPAYQPLTLKLRNNKRGGGVGIMIKNDIKFSTVNEMTMLNNNIEILTVKIQDNNGTRLISSLYRPPIQTSTDINNFISEITNVLDFKEINFQDIKYDILGDFNINILQYNSSEHIRDFMNKLEEFNLTPLINRPTRITSNHSSIIDNIFSNNFIGMEQFILPVSISDHFLILKSEPHSNSSNETKHISKRCFCNDNILKFETDLVTKDWNNIISETDSIKQWDLFFNNLDSAFTKAFPMKIIKIKNNVKKANLWINNEIKALIKKERKLYLRKLNSPTPHNILLHKNFKNSLNSSIRKAKIKYFENHFKHSEKNSKLMWSKINEITNNKTKTFNTIDKITFNNNVITDKNEIASNMNNFFIDIGTKLAENITVDHNEQQQYLNELPNHNCKFKFKHISIQDLLKIEKSLKPKISCGPDEIPSKIIKKAITSIPYVFLHLINNSLDTGTIHKRLKDAVVIPIYKKGSKNDPNNYRPISLINAISKIIEKIIAFQLRKYLEQNKLINEQQFGFRKGHSTIHAMISSINHLETQKRNKHGSTSIFIDLSKAFDTVNIQLLLTKLKKYGIQDTELKWFESYLKGRTQSCRINGQKSTVKIVKIGVPQGSILGPLLFIIYINDFPDINKNFINLFADDTKITISSKSKQEAEIKSNEAINNANKWFKNNMLTLNPDKTRIINFNMKNDKPTISLENNQILEIHTKNTNDAEKHFKFLGFHIDETLNFEAHTQKIINKLNSANHILRKIKNTIPLKQKILIYNAIFKPHLEYGAPIWAKNKKTIDTISKIQKKAIRFVDGNNKKKHTEHLFKRYRTLKFQDLTTLNALMIAHSVVFQYAPDAIKKCIFKIETHERLRRNTKNLQIDSSDPKSITKYIIPFKWNNLRNELKEIKDKHKFRKALMKDFLYNYKGNQSCNDINCRICNNR